MITNQHPERQTTDPHHGGAPPLEQAAVRRGRRGAVLAQGRRPAPDPEPALLGRGLVRPETYFKARPKQWFETKGSFGRWVTTIENQSNRRLFKIH